MNSFEVPKKVNRHVLKALNTLCDGKIRKRIPTALIIDQVIYQMRDLVPVPHIGRAVENSLRNLSELGIIESSGTNEYAMGRSYAPKRQNSSRQKQSVSKPTGPRKRNQRVWDHNDPPSEGSLSADYYDPTPSDMPSNSKRLRYNGSDRYITKAKAQPSQIRDYASDARFLSDNTALTDWSGVRDWDVENIDHLQHIDIGHEGSMTPSLEITEIPYEHTKLNIEQSAEEKTNDDADPKCSATDGTLVPHQSKSVEALKTNSETPLTLPNTTAVDTEKIDVVHKSSS